MITVEATVDKALIATRARHLEPGRAEGLQATAGLATHPAQPQLQSDHGSRFRDTKKASTSRAQRYC